MTLLQAQARLLGPPEADDFQVVRTAPGVIIDARGKRYLDFVSGWCVGNFGWGARHLRRAISNFRGPDYVPPKYVYEPWVELARLLLRLAPKGLARVYRATGGTEAVEIALQLAQAATGRSQFISIEDAYHGNSIGALSIGEREWREHYPNRLRGCQTVSPPLDGEAAARVERMLKGRKVAALVMEPVVTNLSVLIPEPEFMARVAQACRRTGTLLVMDEVACGWGRTGKLFASEHYRLAPDILCLGKAITGGYAPLGATLATAAVARATAKKASFYSTYGWHPLSTAVALANLRWIAANRVALLRGVAAMSGYFGERLSAMPFKEVRIKGLAIGVTVGSKAKSERIAERCRKQGLLIGPEEEDLVMFPPLNLERRAAARALDILEAAA